MVRFREIHPAFPAIPKISTLRSPQLSAIAYLSLTLPNDRIKALLNDDECGKANGIDEENALFHSAAERSFKK
jgi:hypothetical protein